jgi:pimeloyl-ACP methyl ester carboxylesterase
VSIWLVVGIIVLGLLSAGAVYERLSERRDRKRFPAPGRLIDIGGRRLHLLCRGEAPGPTVVIEQGAGSPSLTWWSVQARIAEFARVCTYDRAGYLWSDSAPGVRTLDDRVSDLHALLSSGAVPQPYVLVGHSLGGLIVRRFARAYPDLVAGLVLVDSPDEPVVFRDSMTGYYRQGIAFQRTLRVLAHIGVVRLIGRRLPMLMLPDDETGYALCVTPQHATAVADDFRSLLTASADVRLPQSPGTLQDLPVLLLTHGIPFPPLAAAMEEGWTDGQRRLLALSRDGELIVATKSGHLIHVDEPELVVEAVKRMYTAACDRSGLKKQGTTARSE